MAPHVFVEDRSIASIDGGPRRLRGRATCRARLARYHGDNVDVAFRGWNDVWLDPGFRAWNIEDAICRASRARSSSIQGDDDPYGTLAQLDGIAALASRRELLKLDDCRHSPHRDQARRRARGGGALRRRGGSPAGAGAMTFRVERVVRFEHCDPAGIVFFPRVFALLNEVVEDWSRASGRPGTDFATLHLRDRLGVPTVQIECEFLRASRLGEKLDFALDVESLGRASFVLAHAVLCGDELRVHARATLCFVSLDAWRDPRCAEALRAAMARDLVAR